MTEKINKKNYLKIVSISYLILFCLLKICAVTKLFESIPLNPFMFAMGCIIIFFILLNNKFKIKYPKILIIFGILVIINMLVNFDIGTIKTNLFELFYIFVIYNIAYEYFNKQYYNKFLKLVVVLTTIIITIFMINYLIILLNSGTFISKNMITNVVFSNINGGATLALINIIFIAYLYKDGEIKKSLAVFFIIFFTVFLIISEARTSIYTLIILGLCYIFSNYFKNNKNKINKKTKIFLKNLVLIFIIIIFLFMLIILLKRNYNKTNTLDNQIFNLEKKIANITSLRYWLWKYSIEELINNNLLFGLKFDLGKDVFANIKDEELLNSFSQLQINILSRNNLHSGFIQILVRNGLVGFVVIMTFFIIFANKILKLENSKTYFQYIKYLYLYYILINLFEDNILLSNSFLVLFLWIQIGMDSRIIENKQKRKIGEK